MINLNQLNDNQLATIAENRPEWMAENRPDWISEKDFTDIPEDILNLIKEES